MSSNLLNVLCPVKSRDDIILCQRDANTDSYDERNDSEVVLLQSTVLKYFL